ncbi:NADH(P)-binding protein [Rathayibacter rathayi]|uniref:NADH(P)-binding protein n=2 Tax=Rathayibacter rathayi TaxID=33887 RepID=A0ABD6W7V8_RATRA|nr:NADH(P)-binding protein [Rathayibacter rathayi]MWV75513.1 NADH(P)-binding protein [Rathayibacter rathayi NCPPB 2980 = VKM Ac-1601]PPF13020.1 NADH(P)-binding protein [Rathayibacter rathayi]PPF22913.1 NADH(P)-binding protein [Rathayibacter rathayi]PPF48096.1 NADH(P)-binding protein [Rathayibacter rathayi]
MRVVIVGGGISGNAIKRAVEKRGAEALMLSRKSGFDVLKDDAAKRLEATGADAVVEAAGHFTMSSKVAKKFFTQSTKVVSAASRAMGARHVLLSIVNCGLPIVQGYGYFAGKTAQEKLARKTSEHLTIVRSTQWYEFAGQNLERMKLGPIALVPGMTIAPVSLDAVADLVAECALGLRAQGEYDITGPETTTLWDMTKALPNKTVKPLPMPIPGGLGRAFRDGTLVPGADAEVVGPTFSAWLRSAATTQSGK